MPSIFIWKSDKQRISNKTIRIYNGSNWILEENISSKSYKLIEQNVICDGSVIIFNIKNMPYDWVGTELLEVTQVPYELIKTDNYGTLEQIGNWTRFTSLHDIHKENVESEFNKIKLWINTSNTHVIDPDYVQQQFKNFLIKFDINKIKK